MISEYHAGAFAQITNRTKKNSKFPLLRDGTIVMRFERLISRYKLFCYAHSPLRISGSVVPDAVMPSMSNSEDPIIQSTWIRL